MSHVIELRLPDYANPHLKPHMVYDVMISDRKWGELKWTGSGYEGAVPVHSGLPIQGTFALKDWRRVIRDANAEYAKHERLARSQALEHPGMKTIVDRIAAAKTLQAEFFEEMGVLPGNLLMMEAETKEKLLASYGEWLEQKGVLPSFP